MKESIAMLVVAALVAMLASTSLAAPGHLLDKRANNIDVYRRSDRGEEVIFLTGEEEEGQGSGGSRVRLRHATVAAAAREPKTIRVNTPGEALEAMHALKKKEAALVFFAGNGYDAQHFFERIKSILEEEKGLEHHHVADQRCDPVQGATDGMWLVQFLLTPKRVARRGRPHLPPVQDFSNLTL